MTITGGGTLNINFNGNPDVENGTSVSGINAGDVTLEYRKYSAFIGSPTVNINMNNGGSGPEGDAVTGIKAGKLTVKDDAKLNIEVSGRNVKKSGESDSNGRVNRAISASSMELLDNASVDITSYKNVVTDIYLFGGGDALTVNTTGHLNIKNQSIVTFADQSDEWNRRFGYPDSNIYLKEKNATFTLEKAEGGVSIDSYSTTVDTWYTGGTFDLDWYWPVHGNITLGQNMYCGNHRVDQQINLGSNNYLYTWGLAQYIYSTTGVATVKQSPGLTMDSHAPADNPHGSQLYYAEVIEPTFNLTYIVRKGESIELTTGGRKGTFLYWYDALRPASSGSGTSWTNVTQKFTNIQQDMVLVPVRDPMTNGPTLSDVGYKEQWDNDLGTNIRYAYQDLTFASADGIDTGDGAFSVMLVPAQLPRYGEKTYAAKDLKNRPLMGLRNSRLYADEKAYGSTDELNNNHYSIQTGDYRIAYYDKDTNRCFISKPFTFNPPVAPPYIDPVTQFYDSGGTKQVKITAERNQPIKYRQWDYTKDKWGSLQNYNGPFEVNVTADQDVRIEAYAGPITLDRRSEVRYAVRPTGVPTVKYGDTVLSTTEANLPNRYFYGSIELTVEAPEGYEVWYNNNHAPYETSDGINGIMVKDGKVALDYSGEFHFKLAKVVTVGGQKYRKLANSYTRVKLVKQNELPAPNVTVKTKEGGMTLTPSGPNTYTIKEFVNVELTKPYVWPLNATMAYAYNSSTSPQNAVPYTAPFEVRGEKTISVFTRVPKAGGGYDYKREDYAFKLDSSVKYVMLIVRNATAYDSNGKVLVTESNGVNTSVNVQVGARIKVVPNAPSGKIFKSWSANGIYDTPSDKFKEELFFTMPDLTSNMLVLVPEFADQSEAYITADTKVLLVMGQKMYNGNDVFMQGTVGDSVDLFINQSEGVDYHALRTISYQWWEGESVGTVDNALPTWATFDKSKTYTVKVTITANKGTKFADYAGVQFGIYGSFLKMKDVTRSSGGKSLTFTATPLREMNLTLPTLHEGDSLSKVQESFNTQLSPMGYEVEQLTWESGTPAIAGSAGTNYRINTLKLKLKQNRPLVDNKVIIDGTYCFHKSDSNGSLVVVGGSTKTITVIVKSKGVSVSGTAVSWNNTDNVEYLLYDGSTSDADIKAEWKKGGPYTTALAYTPVKGGITANSDGKRYDQTFSFNTIPEGNYKLVIVKPGHGLWIEELTVNTDNITDKSVQLYKMGDVNRDGKVNNTDALWVRQSSAGGRVLEAYQKILADVNRDGKVNNTDALWIRQISAGSRTLTY